MTKDPAAPGRRCRRAPLTSLSLLLAAAGTLPAQQDAQPFAHVVGRVVDERGEPVAGAAIAAQPREMFVDMPSLLAEPRAVTDERGRYRVALTDDERGCWLVYAKADRQAVASTMPWQTVDGTIRRADVALVPGTELIGRLRTPDGAPVAGARVAITSALRNMGWGFDEHVSGTISDERGFFRVPCVAPTALELRVVHPGFLPHTQLAAQTTPLDVRMTPAAVVRVRCVDESGAPIAGVRPTAYTVFGSQHDRENSSDADGRLRVTVPEGRPFRLRAAQYGEVTRSAHTGPLLPRDEEIVLTLVEPEGSRRLLHVVARDDATGEVLERIGVRALSLPPDSPTAAWMAAADLQQQDIAGEANIYVPQNTESVLVEAPGYGYVLAPCKARAPNVDVRMRPECVVRGTVTDAATGKPVADVAVRVLPANFSVSGSGQTIDGPPRTDADGRFEVRGLRTGNYSVQVHVLGARATDGVRCKATPDAPADLRIELPVAEPLTVEVTGTRAAEMRDGPRVWLRHTAHDQPSGKNAVYFSHHNPPAPPCEVSGPGKYGFTPMGSHGDRVMASACSSHRAATSAAQQVFDDGRGRWLVDQADLRVVAVHGSVELDEELPFARIGVLAVPRQTDPRWPGNGAPPSWDVMTFAGVDSTGRFAIDLMPVDHDLHLVDLVTNIVFWSSDDPVFPSDELLSLRPTIRWLVVTREPREQDQEFVVPPLRVSIHYRNSRAEIESQHRNPTVAWPPGVRQQRWLVPECDLTITVPDEFTKLRGDGSERADGPLFTHRTTIDGREHTVRIPLPAPPGRDG